MAQHFLLTAEARKLSLIQLAQLSVEEADDLFASIRWEVNEGKPVCPSCGNTGKCYIRRSRRQWKCSQCDHTFSLTSGTIFAYHKLPIKIYLLTIAIFTNAVKSLSALQLSRDLNCQYKTAWVLAHKLREGLLLNRDETPLDGVCEMDGVYTNHYIRPANNIEDRVDRRSAATPDKRVVLSVRQRGDLGEGAIATRTFVLKSENSFDISKIAASCIVKGSTIHTDEASGYDDLHANYEMQRVNHQIHYLSANGACNNQSESYNSRFRRMQYGQCHHISILYLSSYANEIAYREDTRRWDNFAIFKDITLKCANSKVSNEFCGYWQGNKRVAERLGA
jgi:transposase-like protein